MSTSLTKGTVRVQVRKDTASNWTSADPILAVGEFGFETDTNKLKIGDGSTAWTGLGYIGVSSEGITDGHVLTADGSDGAAWEAGGGGGGATTWSETFGGLRVNNTSTTSYCYNYYPGYYYWTASTPTPDSLNVWGAAHEYLWIAPAAGTLTNIYVTYRGYDTGKLDPVRFYVRKGLPVNEATSVTTTLIGTSDIITPTANGSTTDIMVSSTDISSSNTFDTGDHIWIMLKLESNTGNTDSYFGGRISGTFT